MKKNLDYYMQLSYLIEIVQIPETEGGGYTASIPQLGKYAFRGDGETIDEAVHNLNEVKRDLFANYLKKGLSIPEPQTETEREFSGRFVLRIPSELHRYLALEAQKNGSTLNQFCLYLLTRKAYLHSIQDEISQTRKEIGSVFEYIKETRYNVQHPQTETNNCFPLEEYKKSA